MTVLPRYEQMFNTQLNTSGLQVSTRVKLYELLETLVSLDNLIVNIAIKDKRFSEFIMVSAFSCHIITLIGGLRTIRFKLLSARLVEQSDPCFHALDSLP